MEPRCGVLTTYGSPLGEGQRRTEVVRVVEGWCAPFSVALSASQFADMPGCSGVGRDCIPSGGDESVQRGRGGGGTA